jgi:hypothetical protein
MRKQLFAVLAVLGLVVGTVALAAPASASYPFRSDNNNQGSNS